MLFSYADLFKRLRSKIDDIQEMLAEFPDDGAQVLPEEVNEFLGEYTDDAVKILSEISGQIRLPSAHQVGDLVDCWVVKGEPIVAGATVVGVYFIDGKVHYDITTREGVNLHMVDSVYVHPADTQKN